MDTRLALPDRHRLRLGVRVFMDMRSDMAWLVAAWHELWMEIERGVTSELWGKIEMLSG